MKRRTAVMISGLMVGALVLGGAGAVLGGFAPGITGHGSGMGGQGYSATMPGNGGMGAPGSGGVTGANGGMRGGVIGGMWNIGYPAGMMGGANQSSAQGKTLTLTQARQRVQSYLGQFGTTTLAVDEVMEFQKNFYAIVKDTATGHGAFEVLVNKVTGAVFPEYGPAMMWNTQYGVMRGMMGYQSPNGPMSITPTQATRIATHWLQQNQGGATTEAPEQFPGYYTVHLLMHGNVTGMLSVNGSTGQVWYHTWHGALIQMKDLHA